MTDKELMIETNIMMISLEGNEFLPELISELKVRGFVDEHNAWTQKAIDFDKKTCEFQDCKSESEQGVDLCKKHLEVMAENDT